MTRIAKKRSAITMSKDTVLLYSTCILVAVMLIARDLIGIGINKYFFLGVTAVAFLALPYAEIVYLLCFLFPISCGIPGTYIYALAVAAILFKYARLSKAQLVVPLVFIVQEFVIGVLGPAFSVSEMVSYASRLFLLFFLIQDESEEIDRSKAILFFTVSVLFMALVVAAISLKDRSISDYLQGHYRIGRTKDIAGASFDTMMISNNANNIAYYVISAIACNLLLIKAKIYNRVFLVFSTGVLAFIGMMTISRMYFLVLVLVFGYYFVCNFRLNRNHLGDLVFELLLIIAAVYYVSQNPEIIQSYVDRFGESEGSIDDTRLSILSMYLSFMFENPLRLLLGAGVLQTRYITGFSAAIHNGTTQIFVAYGIVGFITFIAVLIASVRKNTYGKRIMPENYLPLIASVTYVQSIQFLNPFELMMPFAIGVFALSIRRNG